MKRSLKYNMKLILLSLIISMSLVTQNNIALAQDTTASVTSGLKSVISNPFKVRTADELIVSGGSPNDNCVGTAQKGLAECASPTGSGFQRTLQLVSSVPSMATAFMGGEDSGKMAQMCTLSSLMGVASGMLNNGQGKSCQNAISACQTECGRSIQTVNSQIQQAQTQLEVNKLSNEKSNIEKTLQQCEQQATAQIQLAQQQVQANQDPMGGMANCTAALDSDEADEIVDCTSSRFANSPECATVARVEGDGTAFNTGADLSGLGDDSENDLPEVEDREAFWDALRNKNAGNGGGMGGGMGAAGALGGGSSPNNNPSSKTGSGSKKSSSSLMSGGSESGGSSAWGKTGDDDFDQKFSRLNDKKKDLNMLTQKKIGGRDVASKEFGLASDDIWTRVYTRTNTRCTKQLTECEANKSLNPYGLNSKR